MKNSIKNNKFSWAKITSIAILGAGMALIVPTAEARYYHDGGYHNHNGRGWGGVGAGLAVGSTVGFLVGSTAASHAYYYNGDDPYYYYPGPYYGYSAYSHGCVRHTVRCYIHYDDYGPYRACYRVPYRVC